MLTEVNAPVNVTMNGLTDPKELVYPCLKNSGV